MATVTIVLTDSKDGDSFSAEVDMGDSFESFEEPTKAQEVGIELLKAFGAAADSIEVDGETTKRGKDDFH